jgi:hypothetical protein
MVFHGCRPSEGLAIVVVFVQILHFDILIGTVTVQFPKDLSLIIFFVTAFNGLESFDDFARQQLCVGDGVDPLGFGSAQHSLVHGGQVDPARGLEVLLEAGDLVREGGVAAVEEESKAAGRGTVVLANPVQFPEYVVHLILARSEFVPPPFVLALRDGIVILVGFGLVVFFRRPAFGASTGLELVLQETKERGLVAAGAPPRFVLGRHPIEELVLSLSSGFSGSRAIPGSDYTPGAEPPRALVAQQQPNASLGARATPRALRCFRHGSGALLCFILLILMFGNNSLKLFSAQNAHGNQKCRVLVLEKVGGLELDGALPAHACSFCRCRRRR